MNTDTQLRVMAESRLLPYVPYGDVLSTRPGGNCRRGRAA